MRNRLSRLSSLTCLTCLAAPLALAQGPDNALWATNFSGATRSISKIDPIGEVLTNVTIGTLTPFGLAVDPVGNLWVGSNGSSIGRSDPTGVSTTTFASGSFPQSVAIDANGHVWLANRSSNSVMHLDANGALVNTINLPVGTSPIGIIVDPFNQVWVSGFHSNTSTAHTLTVLDLAGNVLNTFTYNSVTPGFGFSFPTADQNGNVWVANQAQSALLQVDQTGSVVSTTPITQGLPRGCAVDGTGTVWLASQGFAGACFKIDAAGVVTTSFAPPSTSFTTVSIDGNGDPWVFGFSVGKAIKLWQVDATPLVEVAVPSGGSAWGGDSSGFHLARLIQPAADFDNDGVVNAIEINAGSNPFQAHSRPDRPMLIQSGVPFPGSTLALTMRSRGDANRGYIVGISLGNGPTVLPDSRVLPLSLPVELYSIGLLDAGGDGRVSLAIPANPVLSNVTVYMSYVTIDPAASLGVATIGNDLQITVR
jgi:streptogramin lyase